MSLYDSVRNAPDGERRLAGAAARYAALRLLHSAVESSGLKKSELAGRLGLGKSAIGHVLNGNGNVRITTLSDYLYEAGLRLCLSVEPFGPRSPASADVRHTYSQVDCQWANAGGVWDTRETLQHSSGSTLLSVTPADPGVSDRVNYESSVWQHMPITVDEHVDTIVA